MDWYVKILSTIESFCKGESPVHADPRGELLEEARKWLGIHEDKGTKSAAVDVFRRATNGVAEGESWCAAFVQYCCTAVSLRMKVDISIPPSELCSAIWSQTADKYKQDSPEPGLLMVWNYPGTIFGHIGIVEEIGEKGRLIWTIEGNTRPPKGEASTTGTGVYRKMRTRAGSPDMALLGYIKPFR